MACRKFPSLLSSSCVFTLALGASYMQAQSPANPIAQAMAAPVTAAKPPSAAKPRLPAEMPATPPKVTCAGGQLTIVANNSTMASVFAAIHGCIGAAIDLPLGSSSTRMFADLGPGPINQVLQLLLGSTDLDYVIQTSNLDSSKIQAVILSARVSDAKDSLDSFELASKPARRAWLETRRNARRGQDDSDGSQLPDSQASASDGSDTVPIATPNQDTSAGAGDIKPEAAASAAVAQPTAPLPEGAATVAPDSSVAIGGNAAPAPADPSPAPATDPSPASPADQNSVSPADKETQDKITNMEQMFEKRKQMIETPAATTPKQQ
jgi:hypothetical protein